MMTTRTIKIDKGCHFLASYALVFSADLVLPLVLAVAFAFAVGVIKELFDYFDYGLFDVRDISANVAGISIAVLITYLGSMLGSVI